MMATWFLGLSALVFFQDTTAALVPVSLQYGPKCEGLRCHQQPQYRFLPSQYLVQPELHQGIQQAEYQHPVELQKPQLKCPYGHSIDSLQVSNSNDQQKLLLSLQTLHSQLQYQNQEQKQQGYEASYQQLSDALQQKLQASYQQSNNAYQQKDYQASYQQSNNAYQQKDYQASYQQHNNANQQKDYQASYEQLNNDLQQSSYQGENNGYLPPRLPQEQVSNNIYQSGYQSSQKESQNSYSSSQNYEALSQQFNNAHLSSQIQQQQLLNANVQQNKNIKTELSQEHQGKFKQTVNYDISHQHQGYNQHQGHSNVYNNAQSSTNIEQHHDIHDHSDGNDGHHEENGSESDKHHKHHDAYYKFQYAVNDQHTGDIKNHKEERSGDEVRGEYSLVEKDGNVRTVKYFADWKTGFHATVHNSKPRN